MLSKRTGELLLSNETIHPNINLNCRKTIVEVPPIGHSVYIYIYVCRQLVFIYISEEIPELNGVTSPQL